MSESSSVPFPKSTATLSKSNKRVATESSSTSQEKKVKVEPLGLPLLPKLAAYDDQLEVAKTRFLSPSSGRVHAHLIRPRLLKRLYELLSENRLVLLDAPAYHGKSSLFQLFSHYVKDKEYRFSMVFLNPQNSSIEDFWKELSGLHTNDEVVYFLSGIDRMFDETEFWAALDKACSSWLPKNIKFILSANTMCGAVPKQLQAVPRLTREEFLLDENEYKTLLDSLSLPSHLDNQFNRNLIWMDCGGHICLTRLIIGQLFVEFERKPILSRSQFCNFYYSPMCSRALKSYFGSILSFPPLSVEFRCILGRLFLGETLVLAPANDEDKYYLSCLVDSGILIQDQTTGQFQFPCPMAHRYFSHFLGIKHNRRTYRELHDYVLVALKALDVSSLDTTSQAEMTYLFQYEIFKSFMSASRNCRIVPSFMLPTFDQLKNTAPPLLSVSPGSSLNNNPQDMVFYIDGDRGWGVVVTLNHNYENLSSVENHPFGPSGPYSFFGVDSYIWLDLRTDSCNVCRPRLSYQLTAYLRVDKTARSNYWECAYGQEGRSFTLKLLDIEGKDHWNYYYGEFD